MPLTTPIPHAPSHRRRARSRTFCTPTLALAALATVAAAFAATPGRAARQPETLAAGSVTAPTSSRLARSDESQRLAARGPWRDFSARNGGWTALWNPVTGTPHRAFGRGVPLPGYANHPAGVEAAVRRFVAANRALFGDPVLELTRAHTVRQSWYVSFRQTAGGLPVLGADWEFRVSLDGRLYAFGADAYQVPAAAVTGPRIPAVVAREAAGSGLAFDAGRDRLEGGESLALLPVAGEAGVEFRRVAEVRVITANPPGDWRTLVDAANGEVVSRQNRVRWTIGGTVTGEVHDLLPTDPLGAQPLRRLRVTVGATPVTTDAAGAYSAPAAGTVTVSAGLRGSFCNVNRSDGVPDASFSTSVADPATVNIAWTALNSHDAERDGYRNVTFVHDYVKALDPALTALDYEMPTYVNINSTCNAFYDPTDGSVNFYAAGGGCPNTATMPDVVYHEYGHGVNDKLYIAEGAGGMNNGALHEGTADVLAAMIQDTPHAGKGFFGPGTVLRELDNTRRWPQDASGDPHTTGLIIGGAFWDLREAVGLTVAANLAHFAKYGLPDDFDDGVAMNEYFVSALEVDDDDANLDNGTPHGAEIIAAFNAHGIGSNLFMTVAHTPLEDSPTTGPFPVTAQATYSGPFGGFAGGPTLHFSVDGGAFQDLAMTPTGGPDEYTASIPEGTDGIVAYYVSVSDTYGGTVTDPAGAPGLAHRFVAGPTTSIVSYDMETNPGWTVGAVGDNATTGIWVRVDPNGTFVGAVQAQPEDDHTADPGAICWVTGNAGIGQAAGVADVDNGRTTLLTPVFDALAGGLVHPVVSYWRWYSNNLGATPGTDFWRVDISNDGGASWQAVENTLESSNAWQRTLVRIEDIVAPTSNMRLRFIAEDAGDGSLIEAAVDDFQVLGFENELLAVSDPGARGVRFAPPAPNPFRLDTRLRFALVEPGRVTIRLFDTGGRAVRTLAAGTWEAGEHSVVWDGRDESGRAVSSGTYFARLSAGGRTTERRVVRIR